MKNIDIAEGLVAVRPDELGGAGARVMSEAGVVAHLAAVVAGAQSYPGDPDLGSALGAFVATWGDQLALLAVLSGSLAVALGAAASLYEETELAIAGAMS